MLRHRRDWRSCDRLPSCVRARKAACTTAGIRQKREVVLPAPGGPVFGRQERRIVPLP
jgi:hypothetical protein